MKTSLTNTRQIEQYLQGTQSTVDKLLFEARLIIDPALRRDVHFQKKVYSLVALYNRELMREKIEKLHQAVFENGSNNDFKQSILQIFKNIEK